MSVTVAPPDAEPRQHYTPWRVRLILRHLDDPQALGAAGYRDMPRVRHVEPWAWLENRIIECADVRAALDALPWFTRDVLLLAYREERTTAAIARALHCDAETVSRHRDDGLESIAVRLGWHGTRADWRERHEGQRST